MASAVSFDRHPSVRAVRWRTVAKVLWIGRVQVLPMLGGKIVEGQQSLTIFGRAFDRLVIFNTIGFDEGLRINQMVLANHICSPVGSPPVSKTGGRRPFDSSGSGSGISYVDFRIEILQGELPDYTCLLGTLVQEIYATHPHIRAACDRVLSSHIAILARDIEAAKQLYHPTRHGALKGLALSFNPSCRAPLSSPKPGRVPKSREKVSPICGAT
jgi:hypothetical protein